MRRNFFERMGEGIKRCFFQKESRRARRVVLAGRDSFVFCERKASDFEESLTDHDMSEMSDARSAEPTSNKRQFFVITILKKDREEFDFLESRGGSCKRFEEFAQTTKVGSRP